MSSQCLHFSMLLWLLGSIKLPSFDFCSIQVGKNATCTYPNPRAQKTAIEATCDIEGTYKFYANLPSLRASNSPPAILPGNIITSTAKPDIVIISRTDIAILELIIPANSHEAISAAKLRKANKPNYVHLFKNNKGVECYLPHTQDKSL